MDFKRVHHWLDLVLFDKLKLNLFFELKILTILLFCPQLILYLVLCQFLLEHLLVNLLLSLVVLVEIVVLFLCELVLFCIVVLTDLVAL